MYGVFNCHRAIPVGDEEAEYEEIPLVFLILQNQFQNTSHFAFTANIGIRRLVRTVEVGTHILYVSNVRVQFLWAQFYVLVNYVELRQLGEYVLLIPSQVDALNAFDEGVGGAIISGPGLQLKSNTLIGCFEDIQELPEVVLDRGANMETAYFDRRKYGGVTAKCLALM